MGGEVFVSAKGSCNGLTGDGVAAPGNETEGGWVTRVRSGTSRSISGSRSSKIGAAADGGNSERAAAVVLKAVG
jgi:hypothetical protein